jgi:hypothetical protein
MQKGIIWKAHGSQTTKNVGYAYVSPSPMKSFTFSGTHKILWCAAPQDYVDTYHTTSLRATKIDDVF